LLVFLNIIAFAPIQSMSEPGKAILFVILGVIDVFLVIFILQNMI
jgi:hypothetical protein